MADEERLCYPEVDMRFDVLPDLQTLVERRLSTGGYADVEDVFRRALEAQDAEESWTDEERRALAAHIEEGFQQAERGELTDGDQVRREIQAMKAEWSQTSDLRCLPILGRRPLAWPHSP